MKRGLESGVFCAGILLILPFLSFCQWTWLNPKLTPNRLNDIVFIDSLNGFITGNNGTLITSDDGGVEWVVNDIETENDLTSIFMVNHSVIYVAGDAGVIMKTTNSGGYWRTLDSGFPLRINDLWFTSVDTGYCVGAAGAILKTTDGAESWEYGSLGAWTEFFSVAFTSNDTGFICGRSGKIYRTSNAGETWHLCNTGTEDILYSLFFTSPDTGYACGDYATLIKTTDGGDTWFEPDGKQRSFSHFRIFFNNINTGFMAHDYGLVFKTMDAGENWSAQSVLSSNLYSIGFADPSKGYVVGDYGIIYNTMDCGETWSCNTTFYDRDFRDAFFLNSDTGFLAATGAVFKTCDGGESWIRLDLEGFYSSFTGLVFPDPDTGYIPSSQSRIIKTTDGGMSWNYIYTGFSESTTYHHLNIPGHDTLYVIGYKHLLKSTDEGATWEEIFTSQYSGGNLYFFSNEVGVYKLNNTIYHTKDAGLTWSSFEQAPDGWAYFINHDKGYVLPGNGFLFHTTDGGFSWESIYQFDLDPNDLYFINETTGYACSYLGTIYKTDDAGYTWAKTEIGSEHALYFINFPDTSTGYTGGEGGMLLKNTSPLPVGAPELHGSNISFRVFPNPFDDDFKISFNLNIEDDVEINLFDLSGKLLSELTFSNLSGGYHSFPVSEKSRPQGVYLIRFKCSNQIETVKIIKK